MDRFWGENMGKLCLIVLALHFFHGKAEAISKRGALLGSVCALSIASSSSLGTWYWLKPPQAAYNSNGSVVELEAVRNDGNLNKYPLFEKDSDITYFKIKDRYQAVPSVKVFSTQKDPLNKDLLGMVRQYAKAKKASETDIKADGLEVRISKIEFVRQEGDLVLFNFHLESGPIEMMLQKSVPLSSLQSGNWILVNFPNFLNENPIELGGFSVGKFKAEATLSVSMRYDGAMGLLSLAEVRSDITVTVTTLGRPKVYKDTLYKEGLHGVIYLPKTP